MIYDEPLTFGEAQRKVMAHKRRMGFNVTDIETEFGLLLEELGELHNAWRRSRSPRPGRLTRILIALRLRPRPAVLMATADVEGEIGDVLIFMLSLTDMLGFDAALAVARKMQVNSQRNYRRLANGMQVKED